MRVLSRLFAVCLAFALGACNKTEYTAYALTSTGTLLQFDTKKPTKIINQVALTGLDTANGQAIKQIAFRPLDGALYGVSNHSELCQIDAGSGAVSGCLAAFYTDTQGTTIDLQDVVASFDPVKDQLRVIGTDNTVTNFSVDNTNLIVDPTTGAQVTTTTSGLGYDGGDTNNGSPIDLLAAAYNNNRASTTATTLFALDAKTRSLVRVGDENATGPASVNDGVVHTIAALGTGFDSASLAVESKNGDAFVTLANGSLTYLYKIDLGNGSLINVDTIGDGTWSIASLAIDPAD